MPFFRKTSAIDFPILWLPPDIIATFPDKFITYSLKPIYVHTDKKYKKYQIFKFRTNSHSLGFILI